MSKTYSPKNMNLSFNGHIITGFAESTMITVRQNTDSATVAVGGDGESTFIFSADESGEIEFVLQWSSSSNAVLSNFHNQMRVSRGVLGRGIATLSETGGTTVVSANDSVIARLPDSSWGTDAETRTWILRTGNLNATIGGNF